MTIEQRPPSRPPAIQAFVDAALIAFTEATHGNADDTAFVRDLAMRLSHAGVAAPVRDERPPVARDHLDTALAALAAAPVALRRVGACFGAIATEIPWYRRPYDGADAARFAAGHGNALIMGPAGAEQRDDVLLGVSVMAPALRYPDHRHAPDELYLVLSEGTWRQEEAAWVRPGIGGTVRNPPHILHAMRSGPAPLLAVWALLA